MGALSIQSNSLRFLTHTLKLKKKVIKPKANHNGIPETIEIFQMVLDVSPD